MGLTTADLALRVAHWRLRAEAAERALADLGVTPEEARAGAARSKANQREAERYRWLLCASEEWGICEWDRATCEWVRDTRGAVVVNGAIDAAMALHNAVVGRQPCCIKTDAEK